ncbi:MAG: AraC family transcriptional regulator [Pseudomonadota bacterium]
MSEPLRKLAEPVDASFDFAETWGGTSWASARSAGKSIRSDAYIPGGLHITVGIINMRVALGGFGQIELQGPSLSAYVIPQDGVLAQAEVGAGPSRSFGLHIPTEKLNDADHPFRSVATHLQDHQLVAVSGNPAKQYTNLASAIIPPTDAVSKKFLYEARGLEVLAALMRNLAGDTKPVHPQTRLRNAVMTRDFIEAHLRDEMSMAEMSAMVGISLRTMSEHFKLVFDETVGAYITRRRLEEALRRLADGNPVAQVAYEFGYQPTAFSTAFKRQFGFSPSTVAKAN